MKDKEIRRIAWKLTRKAIRRAKAIKRQEREFKKECREMLRHTKNKV